MQGIPDLVDSLAELVEVPSIVQLKSVEAYTIIISNSHEQRCHMNLGYLGILA